MGHPIGKRSQKKGFRRLRVRLTSFGLIFRRLGIRLGCPIFAYIFFLLRSETKRNRNCFASFSLRFAKQNFFVSLQFFRFISLHFFNFCYSYYLQEFGGRREELGWTLDNQFLTPANSHQHPPTPAKTHTALIQHLHNTHTTLTQHSHTLTQHSHNTHTKLTQHYRRL